MPNPRSSDHSSNVLMKSLDYTADAVEVHWQDGQRSIFHAIWLRDNDPAGRHPDNQQRLFDISAMPEDIELDHVEIDDSGKLIVQFKSPVHTAKFDPHWLRTHSYDEATIQERLPQATLWDSALQSRLPRGDYQKLKTNESALFSWLESIRNYGFAVLEGVGTEPKEVTKVIDLFGYVRKTNYGELFDVIAEEKPINLAYTGLGLGLHTDNPYRDPVPGLQLLHCLESANDGGESVVVDGFAAAEKLRQEHPQDFNLLTQYPVNFRFQDNETDLQSRVRLIETDPQGNIKTIRYNNRSAAPFDVPENDMARFYAAYRQFGKMLHDPAFTVSFKLSPGELFIVDNQRVLHGRSGFNGGKRHLQGCYADWDSLNSKIRVLQSRLNMVKP